MTQRILSVKFKPGHATRGGLGRLGAATGIGSGGITGAVSGAATAAGVGGATAGALYGSTAGPIGTVVGAAIGAIAGALIHTSKFSDWLAADTQIIQQMAQLPAGFQGRTLTSGTLEEMWTAVVVTGAMYSYVSPNPGHSPSDMQNEFNWVMGWMGSILQQMNATPIGQPVNVTLHVGNGVTFSLSFNNPGSGNSSVVAQKVMIPAYKAWCTHNGAVDNSNCAMDAARPINQLLLTLMTDYQIAQYPPPASQSAPATPPATATTQPIVTPPNQATVQVTTPATATAPAAVTTQTAGVATTQAIPTLPPGYGYNYAGTVVPIPSGYTLQPNGYIIDAQGFIFGSANDDQLTAPVAATVPVVAQAPTQYSSYSPPVYSAPAATTTAPVVQSSNSMLYVLGAAALAFLVLNKK